MQPIVDWIVGIRRNEEVARNESSALVDQLVERVLAIGAWLSPDDWPGRVGHPLADVVDAFPVGLHVALLEVGSEAVHVLVVRQDAVGLCLVAVDVEDAEHRQDDGNILFQRRLLEMVVHRVTARQQGLEIVHP